MNTRRLVVALIIAIVVSGVFTLWVGRRLGKVSLPQPSKLQYAAPTHPIAAGQTITAADIKQVPWPQSDQLPDAFTQPQDVIGRTPLYPLEAGEPIYSDQLAAPGAGGGLSAKIPDGMRALSLKSDEIVGVAGFLLPGTHVDVLVTYIAPDVSSPITSTVLQNAEILAAGQRMEPDPKGKPTPVGVVTVLVNPQDAERVVLASAQGKVHFVLRNGSDSAQVDTQPVEMAQLDNHKPTAKAHASRTAAPAKPSSYAVEVVAGDKATTETFK